MNKDKQKKKTKKPKPVPQAEIFLDLFMLLGLEMRNLKTTAVIYVITAIYLSVAVCEWSVDGRKPFTADGTVKRDTEKRKYKKQKSTTPTKMVLIETGFSIRQTGWLCVLLFFFVCLLVCFLNPFVSLLSGCLGI